MGLDTDLDFRTLGQSRQRVSLQNGVEHDLPKQRPTCHTATAAHPYQPSQPPPPHASQTHKGQSPSHVAVRTICVNVSCGGLRVKKLNLFFCPPRHRKFDQRIILGSPSSMSATRTSLRKMASKRASSASWREEQQPVPGLESLTQSCKPLLFAVKVRK